MSFRKDRRNASDSKVPRTVSLFLLDNSLDEAILFTWGFPYQHDALRDFPIGSGNTRATKWLYMLCSCKGALHSTLGVLGASIVMGKKRSSIGREQASKPKKSVDNRTNGRKNWMHPVSLQQGWHVATLCSRWYFLHVQPSSLCHTPMHPMMCVFMHVCVCRL